MAYTDLSLPELRTYTSSVHVPADFDAFWSGTLDEARRHDLAPTFTPVDNRLAAVRTYDVSFAGFGGSLPHENVLYPLAGYAVFVMDTRGQGGVTADPDAVGPGSPGFMTSGVLSPHTYFYRRVMTDAVRAIETARSSRLVDSSRVVVAGGSQGGGLAIAAAGLDGHVLGAMPDVPFLCDFPRGAWIADHEPYLEITRYLAANPDNVEQVIRTLGYFDGTVFAQRARMPALFSVGLMDPICPPSTVYAAYNAWAGAKEIREYTYNEHEGGGPRHEVVKLDWLASLVG